MLMLLMLFVSILIYTYVIFFVAVNIRWVRTDMGGPQATRSIQQGVITPLWLALELKKGGPSGLFFANNKQEGW